MGRSAMGQGRFSLGGCSVTFDPSIVTLPDVGHWELGPAKYLW
jgi:hypothetical protein